MRLPTEPRMAAIGAVLAVLVSVTSACSVGMALSGDPAPDLEACRVGVPETEIEEQLGPPVSARSLPEGGRQCVYEYVLGRAPSPERAIVHGSLDVLTFGLWEIVGTPVEGLQGQRYQMTVIYDTDGNAREIRTVKLGN
jgi:hypothetical protein